MSIYNPPLCDCGGHLRFKLQIEKEKKIATPILKCDKCGIEVLPK